MLLLLPLLPIGCLLRSRHTSGAMQEELLLYAPYLRHPIWSDASFVSSRSNTGRGKVFVSANQCCRTWSGDHWSIDFDDSKGDISKHPKTCLSDAPKRGRVSTLQSARVLLQNEPIGDVSKSLQQSGSRSRNECQKGKP